MHTISPLIRSILVLALVLTAVPAGAEPAAAPSGLSTTAQAPTFYPGTEVMASLIGDCPTASADGVCNAACECVFCGFGGGFCVHSPLAICDENRCRVSNCGGHFCIA